MTTENYLTYQQFTDKDDAVYLAGVLKENGVDFLLEDETTPFDPSFAHNEQTNVFRLKIKKKDFERANQIQLDISKDLMENIGSDHYLFRFSNDELVGVLSKSDEWSTLDYLLARKILADRGKPIDDDRLNKLMRKRLKALSKPEKAESTSIIVGYLLTLPGGLLGIIIGWFLATHKKTLPDGSRVYGYTPDVRKHGRRMVMLGTVILAALVVLLLSGWGNM